VTVSTRFAELERLSKEDPAEFQNQWTATATEATTLKMVVNKCDQLASVYFVTHKDKLANAIRGLSDSFNVDLKSAEEELGFFIKLGIAQEKP